MLMLSLLVLLPIAGAAVALLSPRGGWVAAAAVAAVSIIAIVRMAIHVLQGGLLQHDVPILLLRADGLSLALLMMTAVIGAAVTFYARIFFREVGVAGAAARWFLPLWLVQWGALNGVLLTGNLLAMWLLLEVVGLVAVTMALLAGTRHARAAGRRYFLTRLPGTCTFLAGILLLFGGFGTVSLDVLRDTVQPGPLPALAAALMLLSVFVKAAMFPLHYWLPPAHAAALAPMSALLSGVVVKISAYVAWRLWLDVLSTTSTPAAAQFAGVLAAATIIWGALQALRQKRLKALLAFSTVSQMGYLFLLFPLLTGAAGAGWVAIGWTGGVYQAVSHGLAKAAMLLSAGIIVHSLGSDDLRRMNGIAGRLPMTALTLGVAATTLIGLPPSGGFVAKWLLLKAALESGQWWWAPVLVAGSLLTAGYTFIMLSRAFQPQQHVAPLRAAPRTMQVAALALALAALAIGMRVEEPMQLLAPLAAPR
jgi:multicomponent Na+:H+ antiporter subunit D